MAPSAARWLGGTLLVVAAAGAWAGTGERQAAPFAGWQPTRGAWRRRGDVFAQSSLDADCRAFAPPAAWRDYALELKARKTGGREGFLILFRVRDREHFYWWNVGGWGNVRHAVETRPKRALPSVPGRIATGRWYAIRIVAQGPLLKCYLDGRLVHELKDATYAAGGIGLGSWRTQVEYRDLSVTTLDGKPLYGASPTELTAAAAARRRSWLSRCPPVAFIKRQAGGRRGTNATMHARVHGVGSAICVVDPARPDQGASTIFHDPEGFVFDMSPSYDAQKLVFAYKKKVRERKDSFHIYEIGVDGSGLRQLTRGPFHDVSPVYLPDGRICFNSTRVEAFSMCQNFLAAALYVMHPDGGHLRRLEYNTLCDLTPSVMDDGSILFTRWEYQDKNIFCTEALWTINPDGSRLQLFYGNTLTVPNALYGARQIPGTRKVVCVMAAHHHPPLGAIGLIDRTAGHENVAGIRSLTPEVPYTPAVGRHWRETSWAPGDKLYRWAYTDPWPLAEDLFLVAYGGPLSGGPQRYRLYLLDDKGRKALLYGDDTTSCFHPVALRPRPRPHRVPGTLPEPKGQGRFFVVDVYQGLLDKGVERGQVKALRVMTPLPKKYNTEGPRYSDHYPAIGEGTYYVKWNHGTVPVHPDGSAYFTAPAGVELYFQALDAHGKEIRRMGTITQITDGETQSCIGCHEPRNTAPPVGMLPPRLLAREPDPITPPPWGAGPVDFVNHVQPVLDRYCTRCHSGATPKAGIDLSGDKTRLFSMAFETLVFTPGLVARYHINPGPTGNFPPLATGSWVSRLTRKLEGQHSGVKMDPESRRRIYTWIDANVPYYATWDMTRPHTFGGRDTWLGVGGRKPLPWFADFVAACRAIDRKPSVPDTRTTHPRRGLPHGLRHTDINLTHPAWSRVLTHRLARSAGGLADDAKALFKSKRDPRYQALLRAIEKGRAALLARPRIDMPRATPIPQPRDFGKTF